MPTLIYTHLYILAGFIATRLFLVVISSSSVTMSYTNVQRYAKYYYFRILNIPLHYRDTFYSFSSISYVFLPYYQWSTHGIANLHLWKTLYSSCFGNGLVPLGQYSKHSWSSSSRRWGAATLSWGHFCRKYSMYQSLICIRNLYSETSHHIFKGSISCHISHDNISRVCFPFTNQKWQPMPGFTRSVSQLHTQGSVYDICMRVSQLSACYVRKPTAVGVTWHVGIWANGNMDLK